MRVLIDDNIPGLHALLAERVDVTAMNGRDIDGAAAAGFDALLCRSQTLVDADFLAAAPRLAFVATATSGTDHIDTALLEERGIGFASAHGSNATSVVDYVIAATALDCLERGRDLRGLRWGVVGRGAVGATLCERLAAVGCAPVVSDPPLTARDGRPDAPLASLTDCDVTSLHVPLVDSGSWPTRRLIDADWLSASAPGSLLINAARGGVVDESAWVQALERGRSGVVDTWDGEPHANRSLAARARIITPHIAGHSLDAKVHGTRMVASAFAQFAGLELDLERLQQELPAQPVHHVRIESLSDVWRVVLTGYAIETDDAALRALLPLDRARFARAFDALRRDYPVRRDFVTQPVAADGPTELVELVHALGFARA